MKMYTFPGEDPSAAKERLNDKPVFSHAFDAAVARFGLVVMAWAAGACAAVILAQIG